MVVHRFSYLWVTYRQNPTRSLGYCCKKLSPWEVVVAQLLPMPEVRGSNPIIGKYVYWTFTVNYIEKTKIKKKRPGMAHFLKEIVTFDNGRWTKRKRERKKERKKERRKERKKETEWCTARPIFLSPLFRRKLILAENLLSRGVKSGDEVLFCFHFVYFAFVILSSSLFCRFVCLS